jgi:tetratricopeptide (TPR) repeat protein
VAWDAPISPRNKGFGFAFLPFYYLGAISIGYCAGYFLLIFGGRTPRYQHSMNPLLKLINFCVTGLMWVLMIGAPLVLVCKNWPAIQDAKAVTRAYEQYFAQIEQLLPAQGAVALSDDSFRTDYLEATLLRDGKIAPHLLVDTSALINDPNYTAFLKSRNPQYPLAVVSFKQGDKLDAATTIRILDGLRANRDLYYTHPSFGFFFERYRLEPHGLVYRLRDYPTNVWDAPVPDKDQIAQNQDFWKKTSDNVLPPLTAILTKPLFPAHPGLWYKFMDAAHLKVEPDWAVLPVGSYYGHALDYWGVELQRVNQLEEAGKCFAQAGDLSPRNISARVNLAFNRNQRAGTPKIIQLPKEMREKYSQSSGWQELLNSDGPIDEPDFRDGLAEILANAGQYRQAVQQLDRIRELLPHSAIPCLQLAALLEHIQAAPNELDVYLPDSATCYSGVIANADEALKAKPNEPAMLFLKSVALIQLKEYGQALPVLNTLLSVQTNNYAALLNRAISFYKVGNLDAAKPDYETVAKVAPKAFQAYYGLAEIAYQQKDFPVAIKNYELYLTNAPPHSEEAAGVIARLKELKSATH